jgi:hypothetical protein
MNEQSGEVSILWASDLHFDHAPVGAAQQIFAAVGSSRGAALVITGDLATASGLVRHLELIAGATDRPIFFVLGNHDHYGASVARVRDLVVDLAARIPRVQWLPPRGVVELEEQVALFGVDGWADGRHGEPLATPLVLNDDRLIAELATQPRRAGKLAVKRALADADAARLAILLDRAIALDARRIIIATHVPPFPEALPSIGHLTGPDWLPILVCGATGAVLRRVAADHPERSFLVLCGHTHVERDAMISANLRCMVAGARYGAPVLRMVDLDEVVSRES